jgi:lysozyme
MKIMTRMLVATLVLLGTAAGQSTTSSEFNEPWKNPTRALVIDPFGPNRLDFDQLAKEPRVGAIIHKASDCVIRKRKRLLRKDSQYLDRRDEARRRGYLWGSYHLGGPRNPIEQADFYLSYANPADDEVMALDIEDISPSFMSLADAEIFIKRIKEKKGRYPLLYITHKVRAAIERAYGPDSVFARTPLWYARYLTDIQPFFPAKLWTTYALWQFQSEINCCTKTKPRRCPVAPPLKSCTMPQPIPGTDYDMDVNVFYGTIDELKSRWPFTVRDGN